MYDIITYFYSHVVMSATVKITSMSKTKNPDPQPTKKADILTTRLERLGKAAASRVKKMASSPKVWLYLLITAAIAVSLGCDTPEGLSLGLLYLMPDGEAKSGRTGSVVYMRNGRRRNFVVPSLVQNSYTTAVRASFSSFSSLFKTLDAAVIAGWNSATGFFKSNRFGQSKEVKGKSLYVMLNQNLTSIGETPIVSVPTSEAVVGLSEITIVVEVDPAADQISWASGNTDNEIAHIVMATPNLSAGISKPGSSQFRQISVIPPNTASPFSFGTAYETKFGTSVAGRKMFIKLVPVNVNTGQAGGALVDSAVVAP